MATSFDSMKAYQSIAAAGVEAGAATAITTAIAAAAASAPILRPRPTSRTYVFSWSVIGIQNSTS